MDFKLNTAKTDKEIAEYDKLIEEQEKAEKEKRLQERFENSGIGKRYFDKTKADFLTDTPERKRAYDKAIAYIQDIKDGKSCDLWMCGTAGTGKTLLGAIITRECAVTYRKSYELISEIRRAKSYSESESDMDCIDRYGNYKLLVIDEVGKDTSLREEERAILFQVIDKRYENMKPTVIISNSTAKGLADYLGEHTTDRCAESGRSITFTGNSYRRGRQ